MNKITYDTDPRPGQGLERPAALPRLWRLMAEGEQHYIGEHLQADFSQLLVSVNGQPLSLTKREILLLWFFVQNRNRILNRRMLLLGVWGTNNKACRVVDSAICKLRGKLGVASPQIETIAGFGYRFREPQDRVCRLG